MVNEQRHDAPEQMPGETDAPGTPADLGRLHQMLASVPTFWLGLLKGQRVEGGRN